MQEILRRNRPNQGYSVWSSTFTQCCLFFHTRKFKRQMELGALRQHTFLTPLSITCLMLWSLFVPSHCHQTQSSGCTFKILGEKPWSRTLIVLCYRRKGGKCATKYEMKDNHNVRYQTLKIASVKAEHFRLFSKYIVFYVL